MSKQLPPFLGPSSPHATRMTLTVFAERVEIAQSADGSQYRHVYSVPVLGSSRLEVDVWDA
jgi:hypothetical protein